MDVIKENHPEKKDLEIFFQHLNNNKFIEAEKALRSIQHNFPQSYIFENLLGAILHKQKNIDEAIKFYEKSLKFNPNFTVAINNLGMALKEKGQSKDSIKLFEKAINLDKNYIDAYVNLAKTLRADGKFEETIKILKNALKNNDNNAIILKELGYTFRGQGDYEKSIEAYLQAIDIKPNYQEALYELALTYKESGKFELAIKYWSLCDIKDAKERVLFSLYRLEKFNEFNTNLNEQCKIKNISRLVATLSSHASINLQQENKYNFCKNPLNFIFDEDLNYLQENNQQELNKLISTINNLNISYRKQGLLKNGIQSAGNLFDIKEASIQNLLININNYIELYKKRFSGKACEFINSWPKKTHVNGWFVIMKDGGHLDAHIHEDGWLSGVIYLTMPKKTDEKSGNIEFSLHGGNLPRKIDKFPSQIYESKIGRIILFPSSLYHRTLPFSSSQQRICVSFDLNPV